MLGKISVSAYGQRIGENRSANLHHGLFSCVSAETNLRKLFSSLRRIYSAGPKVKTAKKRLRYSDSKIACIGASTPRRCNAFRRSDGPRNSVPRLLKAAEYLLKRVEPIFRSFSEPRNSISRLLKHIPHRWGPDPSEG